MKSYLLLAGLCAISTLTQAQTEKGQGVWTGSTWFSYSRSDRENNSNGSNSQSINTGFSLSRGAFFKDNWFAGASLSGGWSRSRIYSENGSQLNDGTRSDITTGLNGFVRRYWGQDQWRVFLGGGINLNYIQMNYKGSDLNVLNENALRMAPFTQVGVNYYLNDRVGLEASATSNAFPVGFSTLDIGLVITTGNRTGNYFNTAPTPQTDKGHWVLGGNMEFRTVGYRQNQPEAVESRSNMFLISPSIGWFIRKNTLLGISLPLYFSWDKTSSAFSYGISPYFKKYISDNRLRPFWGGRVDYGAVTLKKDGTRRTAQNTINLAANTGLAYFLGERFIIEAQLGDLYIGSQFNMTDSAGDLKSWNGGLSASLSPGFTINYVFD